MSLQTILHKIRDQCIGSNLYQKLKKYDKLIKEQGLQPSSNMALQIYAAIIKQHYERSKHVQDPQLLFSFSKVTQQPQTKIKPKNLFGFNKFRSQRTNNVQNHHINRKISQFEVTNSNKSKSPQSHQHSKFKINKQYVDHQIFTNQSKKAIDTQQNQEIPNLFNNQVSTYFYHLSLIKKCWSGFNTNLILVKNTQKVISKINIQKKKKILKLYFYQWIALARRSSSQRYQDQKLQQKSILISKVIFLKRLKVYSSTSEQFIKEQLNKIKVKNCFKKIINNNTSLYNHLNNQDQRITSMSKYWKGIFIKKLKDNFQFNQVYWKNKNKVIFIWMILNAIKASLQRKGYHLPCLQQLAYNIQQSQKGKSIKSYIQKKCFQRIKFIYLQSKNLKNKIKNNIGFKILVTLSQYYCNSMICKQIFSKKYELVNVIQNIKKMRFYSRLQKYNLDHNINRFHKTIKKNYFNNFIINLSGELLANKNYQLKNFQCRKIILKSSLNVLLSTKMQNIKLKYERQIIKKIKEKLKHQKGEQILKLFKKYRLQQQLNSIRIKNLKKTIKYSTLMKFKKSIYLKKENKQLQLSQIRSKIQNKVKKNTIRFIHRFYFQNLMLVKISKQINIEKNYQIKWKVFQAIKTLKDNQKIIINKYKQIKKKSENSKLAKFLNIWLQKLAKKLILVNCDKIAIKLQQMTAFQKIIQYVQQNQNRNSFNKQ